MSTYGISFNNFLVTRGNTSGRNMNPEATYQGEYMYMQYICTTDQRSGREDTMTVMLLVLFFMVWELQMLPVFQV